MPEKTTTQKKPLAPRAPLPRKDSVERLREGVAKMKAKRRINPADYGPILVWPETVTVLLDNYERLDVLLDHIRSLEEQVETRDADIAGLCKREEAALQRARKAEEQVETARIRSEALCNAVEIIQQERDDLIDLLRVSVGFWPATPKELVEAQHRVPNRDKVEQIATYVSTPANGPDAQ